MIDLNTIYCPVCKALLHNDNAVFNCSDHYRLIFERHSLNPAIPYFERISFPKYYIIHNHITLKICKIFNKDGNIIGKLPRLNINWHSFKDNPEAFYNKIKTCLIFQ
jgi:hypothetical protein